MADNPTVQPPRTDWLPRFYPNRDQVAIAKENERLRAENAELLNALRLADRLMKEGLPKFNWGASALDSNAITLLNEVPITISKALAIKTAPPKGNDHD